MGFYKTTNISTKIIAAVLVFFITTLSVGSGFADVEINNGKNIDALLSIVGIDSSKINSTSDKMLTRGEFAEVLCSLAKIDVVGQQISTEFIDVPKGHKFASFIGVMAGMGVLNGDGTGAFRPENYIKFAEATAALVRLLGYEPAVNDKTLSGYCIYATQIGLLNGVSGLANDDNVPCGVLSAMLYNSLKIPLMEKVSYSERTKYEINDKKSLLTEKFNMRTSRGVVTATNNTGLRNVYDRVGADVVRIDNEIYYVGSSSAQLYLGQNINFYYSFDKSTMDKTIILITKSNSEMQEFQCKDARFQGNAYYVRNTQGSAENSQGGQKEIKYNLNVNYNIIYNEMSMETVIDNAIMLPENGSIKLIDENNDGNYDTVFITSYEIFVVQDIDKDKGILFDKYNTSKKLEIEITDRNLTITDKGGYAIKFSDIMPWNVVFVAQSVDKTITKLIVSQDFVTGEITEIEYGGTNKIVIDDKKYDVSSSIEQEEFKKLKIGNIGTFYTDIYGDVAVVRLAENVSCKFGYLMNASVGVSMAEELEVRVLTAKNEFENYKVKLPLKMDGANYKKSTDIYKSLLNEEKTRILRQPISYEINENNQVVMIDTAYTQSPKAGESANSFNMFCDTKEPVVYKTSTRAMHSKILLNENTAVFLIPDDINADEKEFVASSISYFGNDGWQRVLGYSMEENYTYANVVVTVNKGAGVDMAKGLYMVSKVTKVINDDEVETCKLYCYMNSSELSYELKNANLIEGLELTPGDLVFLNFDTNKKIDAVKMAYDYSENKLFFASNPEPYQLGGGYRIYLGKVYDKTDDIIKVTTKDMELPISQLELEIYDASRFAVVIYNKKDDKFTLSHNGDYMKSYKDVGKDASKIFIYTNWGDPRTMFIFE